MRGMLYLLFLLATLPVYAQNRKFPYYDGEKWGLTNENREVLIAPRYDTAFWMFMDRFAVVRENNRYGLTAVDGTPIIPCRYEALNILSAQIGIAKTAGKYQVIGTSDGQPLSAALFDSLQDYRHHTDSLLLLVTQNGKWYFINAKGGFIINEQGYDSACFMPGYSNSGIVRKGDKYGVIHLRTRATLVPVQYDQLAFPADGTIEAIKGRRSYFFTKRGEKLPREEEHRTVSEKVNSMQFTEAVRIDDSAQDGDTRIRIYKGDGQNWMIRLNTGDHRLKGYTAVKTFYYEDLREPKVVLKVTQDGKTGLVRPDGQEVLPCIYDDIQYNGDFYRTFKDQKEGLIKPDWKEISAPVLKHVFGANYEASAYYIEIPDGRRGFMDMSNGKIFIPGIKDQAHHHRDAGYE